ncbi:hypothetical protein RRG08_010853 [Elysia crispata]|uniref:Uncharacterized protein n=1 Tax=Elysia crispata TaxID=231223 RepID=A0AAE0XSU6_9GAST|nr:hypothetical protein RRG08_010853 [Elysia crispata]
MSLGEASPVLFHTEVLKLTGCDSPLSIGHNGEAGVYNDTRVLVITLWSDDTTVLVSILSGQTIQQCWSVYSLVRRYNIVGQYTLWSDDTSVLVSILSGQTIQQCWSVYSLVRRYISVGQYTLWSDDTTVLVSILSGQTIQQCWSLYSLVRRYNSVGQYTLWSDDTTVLVSILSGQTIQQCWSVYSLVRRYNSVGQYTLWSDDTTVLVNILFGRYHACYQWQATLTPVNHQSPSPRAQILRSTNQRRSFKAYTNQVHWAPGISHEWVDFLDILWPRMLTQRIIVK